ncbi:hypothetical protein IQ215_10980 [Cyanobacterium stanieri LEGE 03274]|uniref:Uncharacterized protein n=1 Tax=Cyanobacterium stanieri LEGE 03274 TaxID=1828756 RepID=A0ABR9V8Q5_9CHRO|nr:hypothetical protein [Cyanobacterium stanieri]MBE9223219.1 hypothetical protein [Cyanobacterium stanieri LEGE 03274]
MKYFSLLITSFLLIFPSASVRANEDVTTTINAEDVGYLMGGYMCKSLLTTGSMDDPEMLEQFALEATEKYDGEESEEFLSLMVGLMLTENIGDDADSLELMRGAFKHIINDDDCFQAFLRQSEGIGGEEDSELTE